MQEFLSESDEVCISDYYSVCISLFPIVSCLKTVATE